MIARVQSSDTIRIRGGLDIGLEGAPQQTLRDGHRSSSVAISGHDFPGIRPKFKIEPGQRVQAGQTVFVDRKRPTIAFTSPVSGSVAAINGAGRSFDSVEIRVDGDDEVRFDVQQPATPETIRQILLESGVWPAFLSRPFGRIPNPDAVTEAIFVTAMDTNPLAPDPKIAIGLHVDQFAAGLEILTLLTEGPVFVCHAPDALPDFPTENRVRPITFTGRHPAGLAGTHIHHLMPAGYGCTVWQIGYQDVIAIGHLVSTGKPWCDRIVSLAGSGLRDAALVTVKRGTSLDDLLAHALVDHPSRVISGPLLTGRESGYLGFYHNQVTVLALPRGSQESQSSLSWFNRFLDRKQGGGIIPNEAFEHALPPGILPVPLMRALCIGDVEMARALGCLELVEEDMALISYLCTSGNDYGALLRKVLDDLMGDGP